MNRRGFISMLAGAAGAPLVPWRGLVEPLISLPARPKLLDVFLPGQWRAELHPELFIETATGKCLDRLARLVAPVSIGGVMQWDGTLRITHAALLAPPRRGPLETDDEFRRRLLGTPRIVSDDFVPRETNQTLKGFKT